MQAFLDEGFERLSIATVFDLYFGYSRLRRILLTSDFCKHVLRFYDIFLLQLFPFLWYLHMYARKE
jgi:hypothetical protein